jgi:hypothetical protein
MLSRTPARCLLVPRQVRVSRVEEHCHKIHILGFYVEETEMSYRICLSAAVTFSICDDNERCVDKDMLYMLFCYFDN